MVIKLGMLEFDGQEYDTPTEISLASIAERFPHRQLVRFSATTNATDFFLLNGTGITTYTPFYPLRSYQVKRVGFMMRNKGTLANPMIVEVSTHYKVASVTFTSINTGDSSIFLANNIANVNLAPTMTSNTTPSPYVVSATSQYSGGTSYWAFNAFDKNNINGWLSNARPTVAFPQALVLNYASTLSIDSYTVMSAYYDYGSVSPRDWTFEGSNNGTSWTVLDTRSGVTTWASNTRYSYTLASQASYQYYRMNITANNGSTQYVGVGELELYSSTSSKLVENKGYGRFWIYDATGNNVILTPDNVYAIRVRRVSGSTNIHTPTVFLELEEVTT